LLQASRWRVKTANTLLQIPWKKVKSYANTPTWSKNSANSQCKAWICKKISRLIWGRCNLKRSRRTVIFLPVYKISSLKITPPKTQNSGQFSYPLPNIVSFLFRLEFRFRSRDFSFNLFPVWQPYCWRFWSAIVPIHTCICFTSIKLLWSHVLWGYLFRFNQLYWWCIKAFI
jgi:hypothetical protein